MLSGLQTAWNDLMCGSVTCSIYQLAHPHTRASVVNAALLHALSCLVHEISEGLIHQTQGMMSHVKDGLVH
jgi:hypothetical protein